MGTFFDFAGSVSALPFRPDGRVEGRPGWFEFVPQSGPLGPGQEQAMEKVSALRCRPEGQVGMPGIGLEVLP